MSVRFGGFAEPGCKIAGCRRKASSEDDWNASGELSETAEHGSREQGDQAEHS